MELWPAIMAPRAFQFLETTPRCHELSKLRQAGTTNRLNGGWAGCHDRFSPLRPVGGEMFLLTAPFMERRLSVDEVTSTIGDYFRNMADCLLRRFSHDCKPTLPVESKILARNGSEKCITR
jgi:hypothetical protein